MVLSSVLFAFGGLRFVFTLLISFQPPGEPTGTRRFRALPSVSKRGNGSAAILQIQLSDLNGLAQLSAYGRGKVERTLVFFGCSKRGKTCLTLFIYIYRSITGIPYMHFQERMAVSPGALVSECFAKAVTMSR